ncbi:MAG: SDR family NAD(P)-dependent oxidoreductase [Treponema sp.]|jgi:sorbitol-6-phosphate 2-dehydrogenase|nr:SDR family NAD(P)-dependent oxidoreductase [Treponema sp.]
MSGFDYAGMASIIRGQYLCATQTPWIVVRGDDGKAPPEAITVDIGAAWSNGTLDEAGAAKLFQEAFAAWEFEMAPSGVEAVTKPENLKKLPSCVIIRQAETVLALYWIDADIDAAWKRMREQNAALLSSPRSSCGALGLDARLRAGVVKNRIALVTGGAQGFGEEIVRGLSASGALVFIADLNYAGAEALAQKINAAEKRTAAIPAAVNVSDEASVEGMFRAVADTAGGLDLCVSNAGVLRAGSVLEQDLEEFRFVTGINYTGFFIVAKHAAKLLRRQYRTAKDWKTDIIQINSKSGLEGSNKNGAYAGGKFGGIGLTASFALELVDYNIKVNAICPGNFFDGPLWSDPEKGLFVQYLAAGKVPGAQTIADVKAFYEAKVPMKRGCTGADVMRAIYYIVEQEYETGQAVPVTGGQVMLH